MRTLTYILFLVTASCYAQGKYLTKTGEVSIEASVPSFEEVAAKNNSVTAIINTENGEIAALALINGFRFKNALMEEHFNENYAESNKYPKAIFQGKIEGFSLQQKPTEFKVHGELTFHGVTKSLESILVTISMRNDEVFMTGEFKVLASDFKIEIPKIVRNKVAEDVQVSFSFKLLKK